MILINPSVWGAPTSWKGKQEWLCDRGWSSQNPRSKIKIRISLYLQRTSVMVRHKMIPKTLFSTAGRMKQDVWPASCYTLASTYILSSWSWQPTSTKYYQSGVIKNHRSSEDTHIYPTTSQQISCSTMSTVSASGLGTLIFLILIGPFIYLVRYLYEEKITHRHGAKNVLTASDGRDKLSSRAYLFALVGYAIGIGTWICHISYVTYWHTYYLYDNIIITYAYTMRVSIYVLFKLTYHVTVMHSTSQVTYGDSPMS